MNTYCKVITKDWENCNKWRVFVRPHKTVCIHVHAFDFIFIIFTLNPDDGLYGPKNVAYL
jgi:hypothetical protein